MSSRRWRAEVARRDTPRVSSQTRTAEGELPIGVVAQITGVSVICSCCGLPGSMLRVRVEAVADGSQTTIVICPRCLDSTERAWRLRFRPIPYER